MNSQNHNPTTLELIFLLVIVVALVILGTCTAKASIPDRPPLIDLEPQAFNTWLSGRFIEWPDEFERVMIQLEQQVEARGEKYGN